MYVYHLFITSHGRARISSDGKGEWYLRTLDASACLLALMTPDHNRNTKWHTEWVNQIWTLDASQWAEMGCITCYDGITHDECDDMK